MKREYKYKYVYKTTCLVENSELFNHYYIGQHKTNNLDDGYFGSGKLISRYFKEYGIKEGVTVKKEILAFAETHDELNKLERYFIGYKWKEDKLCLNRKTGGGQYEITDTTIKKISETLKVTSPNKGKHLPEETRKKISKSHKGKHLTEECKRKMSLSTKGIKKHSEETKRKISEGNKGKRLSDETKEKIRQIQLGRHHTVETKERLRQANLGKHLSEEAKRKQSEALKNRKCINNGIKNKLVKESEIEIFLSQGWILGGKKRKRGSK